MSKVKLIAINPKYRTIPYFAVPVYDKNKRVWITGQENLSKKELEKEPFIVNVNDQYPLTHMMDFDTERREDQILLAIAKVQEAVAPDSKSAIAGKHLFYIQNPEKEAEENINNVDHIFEAMKLFRENGSFQKTRDLAIYLGLDASQTLNVLQSRIYTRIQDNPKEIINFFDKLVISRLLTRKVIYYGILINKGGIFYDHDRLIGRDEREVELFISDKANTPLISKWSLEIERKEGIRKDPLKEETYHDECGHSADGNLTQAKTEPKVMIGRKNTRLTKK